MKKEVKDKIINDVEFCKNIATCDSLEKTQILLDVLLDFYFEIIISLRRERAKTQALADSKHLFQMMFTKGLSLKRLLQPIGYDSPKAHLNPIIDFVSVNSLVRDIYELFCAFELIYIIPNTDDKKLVMYDLFQLQSLCERQKYNTTDKDLQKKKELEKKEIEDLKKEIRETVFYNNLDATNKGKLNNHIEKPRFRIVIDSNNIVRKFDWTDDMSLFGAKKDLMDNIYSYLSENSHPSFLAIMQFRDAFDDDLAYRQICNTTTLQAITFLSMFVADYCRLFPKVVEIYRSQDNNTKKLIDFWNVNMRGKTYSIDPTQFK